MSGTERERATLGGGCFWCMEAVFKRVDGVESVTSGYAGGDLSNPSYEMVCTGETGHAEVVQIDFDPSVLTYEAVLQLFFRAHNPTTLNRQGADIGTQYRSVIFYASEQQRETARSIIGEMSHIFRDTVVTELTPLEVFYPAEDYHQDYFDNNPTAGYCQAVIAPKLGKLGMPGAPRPT